MSTPTTHIAIDTEVLIAGSGPAALCLAAACAVRGLRVMVVSDAPEQPFEATYGVFADQLPASLSAAVQASWPTVIFRSALGDRRISRPYVRLNSTTLHSLLHGALAQGCTVRAGRVSVVREEADVFAVELASGEVLRARRVIDCTGHARALHSKPSGGLAQLALGATLSGAHGLTEPLLMDFGGPERGTFLYALPLTSTELFVEETALITERSPNWTRMESDLRARLDAMGLVGELHVHERCVIPMDASLPDLTSSVLAFGAAAGLVHPATGYQLAACLALAEPMADRLANTLDDDAASAAASVWEVLWPSDRLRVRGLRVFGARFVASLDHADQAAFFDAFFRIPPHLVRAYLGHDTGMAETCDAMLRVFLALPWRLRWKLARVGVAQPMPIVRPLFAL
ncbi:MAG: lycopene cyclase family protein [Proteobacteria bacterium]|nr:lycopene cyclase family protein [Pseudomonadota bacterium]